MSCHANHLASSDQNAARPLRGQPKPDLRQLRTPRTRRTATPQAYTHVLAATAYSPQAHGLPAYDYTAIANLQARPAYANASSLATDAHLILPSPSAHPTPGILTRTQKSAENVELCRHFFSFLRGGPVVSHAHRYSHSCDDGALH